MTVVRHTPLTVLLICCSAAAPAQTEWTLDPEGPVLDNATNDPTTIPPR